MMVFEVNHVNKKNSLDITIYGQQYTIVGTESTEHISLVANSVDERMKAIHRDDRSLDEAKVAVLAAVNIMHENIVMLEKIKELEDASSVRIGQK